MKTPKFLLALVFMACLGSAYAMPPADWGFVSMKDGFKRAQEENKPIFVLFGFENCPWCKIMYNSTFKDNELRDYYRKEFVLVYMSTLGENEDATYRLPNGQNLSPKEIVKSWKVYPVPSWRWLRPDGSVLGTDSNARTPPREMRFKAEAALQVFGKL